MKDNSFIIRQVLKTNQRGIDIIARNNRMVFNIEVKGSTSSKVGSNRLGKEFDRNQARTHISAAYTFTK